MPEETIRKPFVHYIELHYFLNDESHSMNAYIFNKCEYEVLGIIKELQSTFSLNFDVEIEPIANGGIRSWLKAKHNDASNFDVLALTVLGGIFVSLINNVASLSWNNIEQFLSSRSTIEQLKSERDILQLQYEIQELKKKLKPKIESINQDLIKKKRSNFYSALISEPKIVSISVSTENANKVPIASYNVSRPEFGKFILATDALKPIIDEHAHIEIVAPVLKNGKYKWIGMYHKEIIHFSMKSEDFKAEVFSGSISFKNGFSIDCRLISRRKINEDGKIVITKREVELVNSYSEDGAMHEIPKIRTKHFEKKTKSEQLSLL